MNYEKMGRRIAEIRKDKGYTQEFVAEKADISLQYYSRIERGKNKPTIDTLVNILNTLECTADEVLCDSINSDIKFINAELNVLLENCSSAEAEIITEQVYALKKFIENVKMLKGANHNVYDDRK